jgi:membrane-bound lytic murein transglycosylase F
MKELRERACFSSRLLSILFILTISLTFSSCLNNNQSKIDEILVDEKEQKVYRLAEIEERGKLIAVTTYNANDYFVYRGEPMGYQFEKLKIFAEYLGVELEIKVAEDIPKAIKMVNSGDCDLLAMGMTITKERKKKLAFSEPFFQTRQMLVQHKPESWRKMANYDEIEKNLVRDVHEMANITVHIQKESVYGKNMEYLSELIGEDIHVITDPVLMTDQLIEMVAKGKVPYTICDENLAQLYEKIYPDVDIKTPVSFPQQIAWAVKKDSDSLRSVINLWQEEFNKTATANYLFKKYFISPRSAIMARSEYSSFYGGRISDYDEIIRRVSVKYKVDWLLMASLIYQESQFDPGVVSFKGAFGLMQFMPATAETFGIDSTSSPAEQIDAGIRYLRQLDAELPKEIKDPQERIKFILASYNVGIAHVFDARRLAEKNGKDPNVWTDNVDYYILNKSNPKYYKDEVVRYGYARGEETYNFVREILDRYGHYKNVLEN